MVHVFGESHVVIVLIWSNNHILSYLVTRNLVHRGFDVQEISLPPPGAPMETPPDAALVIVDLDCQEPELWHRAAMVRSALPGTPLVLLGHAWPAAAHLDRLRPCSYVRKPFAIGDLLAAVQDVPMRLPSRR